MSTKNFINAGETAWGNAVRNGRGIHVYDVYISENNSTVSARVYSADRDELRTIMDEVERILDANKTLEGCQLGYRYIRWTESYYNTIDIRLSKNSPSDLSYKLHIINKSSTNHK